MNSISTIFEGANEIPRELLRFMTERNLTENKICNCWIYVNQIGVDLLEAGQQLTIGSKNVTHIVSNMCTVSKLTREDLKTILKITGPQKIINQGAEEHHYKATILVKWIKRIDYCRLVQCGGPCPL